MDRVLGAKITLMGRKRSLAGFQGKIPSRTGTGPEGWGMNPFSKMGGTSSTRVSRSNLLLQK